MTNLRLVQQISTELLVYSRSRGECCIKLESSVGEETTNRPSPPKKSKHGGGGGEKERVSNAAIKTVTVTGATNQGLHAKAWGTARERAEGRGQSGATQVAGSTSGV